MRSRTPSGSGVADATVPISVTIPVNIRRPSPIRHSGRRRSVASRDSRNPAGMWSRSIGAAMPPSPITHGAREQRDAVDQSFVEEMPAPCAAPPSTSTLDMPCAARSSSSSGRAMRPSNVSVASNPDAGALQRRLARRDRPRRTRRPAAARVRADASQLRVERQPARCGRARCGPASAPPGPAAGRSVPDRRPARCRCRPGSHRPRRASYAPAGARRRR